MQFQIKRPKMQAAIQLGRVIRRPGLEAILSEIASHGGGEWRVVWVRRSSAGDCELTGCRWCTEIEYQPARGGVWRITFGIAPDGSAQLWAD